MPNFTKLPAYLERIFPYLITNVSARQISVRTGLAIRTIQAYTQEIYEIYDVHSREGLIREVRRSQ
ncbi:MAG: hypothetical protein KGL39_51100 [Patescibacteria group bacterium]|nr:hypothetical protein [Patescibacteria group bacterium]